MQLIINYYKFNNIWIKIKVLTLKSLLGKVGCSAGTISVFLRFDFTS
jgi:hypothetical protein